MRTWMLATMLVLCVALPASADEAQLKAEIAALKLERQALEDRVRKLNDRVTTLESELGRFAQFARELREATDRLMRVEGTPLAVRPDPGPSTTPSTNPSTSSPFNTTTSGNNNPSTTPTTRPTTPGSAGTSGDDPFKTLVKDAPKKLEPLAVGNLPKLPDTIPSPSPRPAGDRAKGTPTTVAMVDMLQLFNALKEKEAIEAGLADLVSNVQFVDQTWAKRVREYDLDLSLLQEGTNPYIEKKRQAEAARIEREVALAAAKTRLNRKRGDLLKGLYAKMIEAIGRVSDENGYDMVVFKEGDPEYDKSRTFIDAVTGRMVVQGTDSVDLTEQVVRLMNREFERGSP